MKKYLVVIEKAAKNYSAYSPDVPGCVATGKTVAETRREFKKALAMHLELLRERGQAIPRAESQALYVVAS